MNIWQGEARLNLGDVTYPPGGRLGPRLQPNLQLVYVWTGSTSVWINGHRSDVRAGECILLLPHRRERFAFSDTASTHHGWCEVVQPAIEPAFERQLSGVEGHVFRTPPVVRDLSRAALQLKEDPRWGSRLAFADLASCILHTFAATAGLSETPGTDTTGNHLPVSLVRAIERIHGDPAGTTTIAAIAASAGVSQQHLSRLFRKHVNATPSAYLWRVRTQKAVELIRSTGLSLAEIARQCGFKTQFHLSRRVREHEGIPPSELR